MNRQPIGLLCVLGTLGPALLLGAKDAAKPRLEPDLPYQARKTNPVSYEVDFAAVVTPPYQAKVLKVWLPLPQSDAGQEVEDGELSAFPLAVKARIGQEKVFGNKFAYFQFDNPEGAQVVRHKFKIKVWELRWDLEPQKLVKVADWPASFGPYLQGDQQAVVINDEVRKLAGQIVPKSLGPIQDLTAVMAWVNRYMTHDHVAASLGASAEQALKRQRGHCSDYHGLCASFGRVLGLPTRVAYGINPFPKNSPSHCKLEVFLAPYGWVSFDVSETQRLCAEIQKAPTLEADRKEQLVRAANRRLAQGFRDNTWFGQTRGTDYELGPPAAKRVAVVRTVYAEADGVALPEPDPANPEKREFGWMTVHSYKPDQPVKYPFKGWESLQDK